MNVTFSLRSAQLESYIYIRQDGPNHLILWSLGSARPGNSLYIDVSYI